MSLLTQSIVAITSLLVAVAADANEQSTAESSTSTKSALNELRDRDYALTAGSAALTYGVGGLYAFNDTLSAEAVIGAGVGARGMYTFQRERHWHTYGFGAVGAGGFLGAGVEAGAGIEYSWLALAPTLPPLSSSIELGVGTGGYTGLRFNYLMRYNFLQ